MNKIVDKIQSIVETFMYEAEEGEENTGIVKIFYNDLDIDGKQKVLQAIDDSFEYVDVFSDDVVKDNIEEALSKRPLIVLSGEEIVNKSDIEL